MRIETRSSRSENLSGVKATLSRDTIKRLSVLGTLILALGVLAPSPAFATTTACSGGGTFTIDANLVKSGGTCVGTATIPNTVTGVADFAFKNATGLTAIVFQAGSAVASIGKEAFAGTTNLNSVTFPEGLVTIGYGVFTDSALPTLNVPSTVTDVGTYYGFYRTGFQNFIVDPANPNYSDIDGVLFDKSGQTLIEFPDSSNSTSYSIPQGTLTLGENSFANTQLQSVVIPTSVTAVGDSAFDSSFAISSLSFTSPSSVETLGAYAFASLYSLPTIEIPASVHTLGDHTFAEASDVVFAPGSALREIADYAFADSYFTDFTIPPSVTSIGQFAFWWSSLTSIEIPASVTSIGRDAFKNASSLNSVTFLGDAPSVGTTVFFGIASEPTLTYQYGASGFEGNSDFDAFNLLIVGTPPTAEPAPVYDGPQAEPAPVYDGPQLDAMQSATSGLEVGFSGRRLGSVTSAYAGSFPLEIVSASDGQLVLKIPAIVVGGSYDLVLDSAYGKLTFQNGLRVFDAPAEVITSESQKRLSVGSFKGLIAIYSKGYEGQKLSAKIAGKWMVVDSLNESFNGNNYSRTLRFTGAGYDILVHLYIDGKFVKTEELTTR